MLLSIIIPVFNGENKIKRCLDSIQKINSFDVEFIIVDDGSTDKTKDICNVYKKIDNRIRVFSQKNSGVSKARNLGLKYSTGKYIGFLDADDELTEDYVEIIKELSRNDCELFAFDHCVKTRDDLENRNRYLFSTGKNNKLILYNNFLAGASNCVWNNVYLSEIIKENHIVFPENMKMGEDCIFNAHYLRFCKEVYYIKKTGYKYYADDNNTASNANKICYLSDFVRIYNEFMEIYKLDDGLTFDFYFPYYIDKVFKIIKTNKRSLVKNELQEFKKSDFFSNLMKYKYKKWNHKFEKWYIKVYMSK